MVGDSSPATKHMLQHRPACCMQHSHATRQNVLQNMLLLAAPKLLPGRQEERCVLSPEPQARGAKTTRLHVARRMPRVMHWPSQVARAALQCARAVWAWEARQGGGGSGCEYLADRTVGAGEALPPEKAVVPPEACEYAESLLQRQCCEGRRSTTSCRSQRRREPHSTPQHATGLPYVDSCEGVSCTACRLLCCKLSCCSA
jgi:hypothetical protein